MQASGPGISRAQVGVPEKFVITTKKTFGVQPQSKSSDIVEVDVTVGKRQGEEGERIKEAVTRKESGVFEVEYTIPSNIPIEQGSVSVRVNGVPIHGSPFTMSVYRHVNFARCWGGIQNPQGIAIGPNQSLYICDQNNNCIQVYSKAGRNIHSICCYNGQVNHMVYGNPLGYSPYMAYGQPNQLIPSLAGVFVHSNGEVYVSDSSNRIQVFTSEGKFIRAWGSSGLLGPEEMELGNLRTHMV
jgi:hypothetical protein